MYAHPFYPMVRKCQQLLRPPNPFILFYFTALRDQSISVNLAYEYQCGPCHTHYVTNLIDEFSVYVEAAPEDRHVSLNDSSQFGWKVREWKGKISVSSRVFFLASLRYKVVPIESPTFDRRRGSPSTTASDPRNGANVHQGKEEQTYA